MGRRKHGWEWTFGLFLIMGLLGIEGERWDRGLLPAVYPVREERAEETANPAIPTEPEAVPAAPSIQSRLPDLPLHSLSAVLMDAETGRILYGKEADAKRPMASTTKIMTCILALEKGNLSDQVKISGEAASQPQVRMGVKEGETYALKDLLYALMLESYNDSAVAIAEHIGGSVTGFAEMMNEKARELGCVDTYFITPNGLDAQKTGENGEVLTHSTTAADLARIMAYCVLESPKKEAFLEITRTRNHSFTDRSGKRSFSCANHNAMLDMDSGLLSGKTGFTGGAGYSYVAAAEDEGRVYTIALLGCGWPPDKTWKWQDAKKLLSYGREYFYKKDVFRSQEFTPISVENGIPQSGDLSQKAEIALVMEEESLPLLLAEGERVEVRAEIPRSLSAPVQEGEPVGQVTYTLDGAVIGTFPVRAKEGAEEITVPWCVKAVWEAYVP